MGFAFRLCFFVVLFLALTVSGWAQTAYELPRTQVFQLTDTNTQRTYALYVQVPPHYARQPQQDFPLVLMTDAAYSFPLISGAARLPMNTGKMQPAILVGLSYEQGFNGQQSRVRDYTISEHSAWPNETGGAKQHARFIAEQVLPYLANEFRMSAKERTFVGHSLGGLFGGYLLARYPDAFDNYILSSPSFWYNDGALFDFDFTATEASKKVLINIGANENDGEHAMLDDARQFYEKLLLETRKNVQPKLNIVAGSDHETAFPAGVTAGLAWILKPPSTATNSFAPVEHYDIEYEIAGSGEQVIFLEAGGGSPLSDWDPVFDALAQEARVIRYARVGNGNSTQVRQHMLSSDYARHARQLLDYLDIEQPVIYVAHSYGGSVAREFAAAYPDRLKALMLLDPSSEHDVDVLRAIDLDKGNQEIAAIKLDDMKNHMSNQYLDFWSKRPLPDYPEIKDMPVTVIASIKQMPDPPNLFFTDAGRKLWGAQWQSWAEAFPQGKAILTAESGHFVQFDQPALVIAEVKALLERTNNH